ncbi:MAG: hypothetical protein HND47_23475 [Chloroflexi bacterium]|nr:hypothetical protein [Chloroflexota bacterium]
MIRNPIVTPVKALWSRFQASSSPKSGNLYACWVNQEKLPEFIRSSQPAVRFLNLLGPLFETQIPERNLIRNWGQPTIPNSAFLAACLIKLEEGRDSMGDLLLYLHEHPALIWLLGFPLVPSTRYSFGFDPQASLPTERHMARLLRQTPNQVFQALFVNSVHLLLQEFARQGILMNDCVSLDTKHILAWVKENNPKAYVDQRYKKDLQPKGDPDCRLGCKRKHNQRLQQSDEPATPKTNPLPAGNLQIGEFYWGYGSGIVVVKIPNKGEFVLAELTQPFNCPDLSYFFPLMQKTEQILGSKPRLGTFDAAFDARYVYDYFHRDDDPLAFAAVPFSEKGRYKTKGRMFDAQGSPLCAAGLAMSLLFTFTDRTTCLVEHERSKYGCPLFFPEPTRKTCPIRHKNNTKAKKGCTVVMPSSIGARLRYTLDRNSQTYKDLYRQRTAVERINSQAFQAGIERPHLRNGSAIANLNTLIYTLINLRFFHRLRQQHSSAL